MMVQFRVKFTIKQGGALESGVIDGSPPQHVSSQIWWLTSPKKQDGKGHNATLEASRE